MVNRNYTRKHKNRKSRSTKPKRKSTVRRHTRKTKTRRVNRNIKMRGGRRRQSGGAAFQNSMMQVMARVADEIGPRTGVYKKPFVDMIMCGLPNAEGISQVYYEDEPEDLQINLAFLDFWDIVELLVKKGATDDQIIGAFVLSLIDLSKFISETNKSFSRYPDFDEEIVNLINNKAPKDDIVAAFSIVLQKIRCRNNIT